MMRTCPECGCVIWQHPDGPRLGADVRTIHPFCAERVREREDIALRRAGRRAERRAQAELVPGGCAVLLEMQDEDPSQVQGWQPWPPYDGTGDPF